MQKFNLHGLPHYHTRLSLLSSDINVLNVLQESSDITWLWLQRSWIRVLLDTPLLNLPSLGDNLLDASNERQLDLLPGSGWRLLPRRWWWWWWPSSVTGISLENDLLEFDPTDERDGLWGDLGEGDNLGGTGGKYDSLRDWLLRASSVTMMSSFSFLSASSSFTTSLTPSEK